MKDINKFEEENTIFWEPTLTEMKAMAKKRKQKEKAARTDTKTPTRIKKKFHIKDLNKVYPRTDTQRNICTSFRENQEMNFFLYGSAGTGKTFLSIGLGLEAILEEDSPYDKLMIVRSVVPSRDIGFLPGTIEEKTAVYEAPYVSICDELFEFSNSYNNLKLAGKVEFVQTSFLRGTTFNDCVVVIDEIQNMTFGELDTIITRVGRNCKIMFSGDSHQNDLINKRNEQSGFYPFVDIIKLMEDRFEVHHFDHNDIVRSGLVKDYIINKENLFSKL